MSLRLLLGLIAPMFSGYSNESVSEKVETFEKDFETPARFHIGMLSISLITGLTFGGFISYKAWEENNIFLGYIRNLIIALVCRTFFSILFDGIIILGTPLNVKGGNTLVVFEQIFLNLVLAFWLTLNIYIHARVRKNFDREPAIKLYQYGIPGVAMFFTFVWIFTLQDQVPTLVWWIFLNPFTQWIVNSLNLLFLLIQLALVGDIARILIKMSLDNDSISLLRYITIMMGVLVLIFWLHFGFILGRAPLLNSSAYLYFHYFIDGLECALVCIVLYFFSKWVFILIKKISHLMIGIEELATMTTKSSEVLLRGCDDQRNVSTNSVFMTSESKRWKVLEEEGSKDVVYSNVVEPERLKKTLELYKRFDVIPKNHVTVVEGETFYDCQMRSSFKSNDCEDSKLAQKQLQHLQDPKSVVRTEGVNFRKDKVREQTQKKNAFYSSKYLILDSKEGDFPKYLETRPSNPSDHPSLHTLPSVLRKENQKEEHLNKNFLSSLDSLMSEELVRKWLFDNSENMQKKKKNKIENYQADEKEKSKQSKNENLDSKMSKHKYISDAPIQTENKPQETKNQTNMFQTILSTTDSVLSNAHFPSRKSERINSGKIISKLSNLNEIKTTVGEQNDAKKSTDGVDKPEIAEFQNKEGKIESDPLVDVFIKTDDTDEKLTINERQSTISNEKNLDILGRPISSERLDIRSRGHELRNEHLQLTKKDREKLTGFPPGNEHHNDSDFQTDIKNISQLLNDENERKEPESFEPKMCNVNVANKTAHADTTEDTTYKSQHDLQLKSKSTFPETVTKSDPMDLMREEKSENTALIPSIVKSSDKSTDSLNEYITYSDLLNFRLQRDKEQGKQPPFSFSDAISNGITSLINATRSFFFSGKNASEKEISTLTSNEIKITAGEQNDAKKSTDGVDKPQIAEFQNKEGKTESDPLGDVFIKTDTDEKLTINERQSTISNEKNLDILGRPVSSEWLVIRSQEHELRNEHLQLTKKDREKLTGFPPGNEHHNDSDFQTDIKNISQLLNDENERKEPESFEPKMCNVNVANKTAHADTAKDATYKLKHDLQLKSKSTFPETVTKSDPMDLMREEKSENTALIPSIVKSSDKSTESLNEYISYSEPLKFRLQLDKEQGKQPPFSFSDVLSNETDPSINPNDSFFFSPKNSPENERLRNVEAQETKECHENLRINSRRTLQDEIDEKPQINNNAATHTAKEEKTEVLRETFHDSQSALGFQISKSTESKYLAEQIIRRKLADEFEFSQPYQLQQNEPIVLHLSKDVENINDFDNLTETELPSKSFTIKKEELISKNKTSVIDAENCKIEEQKSFEKFNAPTVTESEIDSKIIQKPYLDQFELPQGKNYKATMQPKNQTETSEISSDSEFSVERRKKSTSSDGSFSLDRYYMELMNVQKKFQNHTSSVQNNKTKRKNKHITNC